MKLTCPRSSLASAVQTVAAVVPARTPKDILKNIKLTLGDGGAFLVGTDQEIGIRFALPFVESDSAGEMLLPTQKMNSILREVQDDVVTLDLSEDQLLVQAGHSEFRLATEDPAEFPEVATFADDTYHVVSGRALEQSIQRTIYATDVESTRYALGGVLVELTRDQLTLAATDSRRLALVQVPCSLTGEPAEEMLSGVVPAKAMSLIDRSIQQPDEDVHIALHANDVLVRVGDSTIYSRLVEGRFPNYRQVIPEEFNALVDLNVGPFHSAVRQAMIVTSDESRGVDFTFDNGMLTLTSQASDVGRSKVELPIDYSGEALTITFDPRFVADFLKVLGPEEQVRLQLIDADKAAVLTSGSSYTYVVMPLSRDR